jgi:N-methylhydantoinase A
MDSSTFCAKGLLAGQFVVRSDRSVNVALGAASNLDGLNAIIDDTIQSAEREMQTEGFAPHALTRSATAEMRFVGQSYGLKVALPARPLEGTDVDPLLARFLASYGRAYGAGAAWKGLPTELVSYSVTMAADIDRPELVGRADHVRPRGVPTKSRRSVYLPSVGERQTVTVLDDAVFSPGTEIAGPALVDASDTTIYVPPGSSLTRDIQLNYWLRSEESAKSGR